MPAPKGYGRPRTHSLREILNAVFYVLRSGCQWRLLPHDFPRWPTVYHYFRQWRIGRHLGEDQPGHPPTLTGSPEQRSPAQCRRSGFSVGQDYRGGRRRARLRRRQEGQGKKAPYPGGHCEGFVLKAKVHSAKVMDYEGIKTLLRQADRHFPRLSHLWLDAGYRGEDKGKDWVQKTLGWSVDLVERPRQARSQRRC